MSDTPRTDAAGGAVDNNGQFRQRQDYQDVVEIVFARQLERELNESKKQLEVLQDIRDIVKRISNWSH